MVLTAALISFLVAAIKAFPVMVTALVAFPMVMPAVMIFPVVMAALVTLAMVMIVVVAFGIGITARAHSSKRHDSLALVSPGDWIA